MSSFVEQCLRGDALLEDIDDFVTAWHESDDSSSLDAYLGMTLDEYIAWVQDSDVLPYIIYAHRNRIDLNAALSQAAAMAARSSSLSNADFLMRWLSKKGLA